MHVPALLLALPVLSAGVSDPVDERLTGVWWGGIDWPGGFETAYLEIEEAEGELTCRVGRPYDGIGAQPMEVEYDGEALTLSRSEDGRDVVLQLAVMSVNTGVLNAQLSSIKCAAASWSEADTART